MSQYSTTRQTLSKQEPDHNKTLPPRQFSSRLHASQISKETFTHTDQTGPHQTSMPQSNTAFQPLTCFFHSFPVTHSEFRYRPPTSVSKPHNSQKRKGPLRSLRQRSSHVPPCLPWNSAGPRRTQKAFFFHFSVIRSRQHLHGNSLVLHQKSMIEPSRCLSDPFAQDHHHRDIQHTATENFRAQQEPSLHLSVPRARLHLLGTFQAHTRLTD